MFFDAIASFALARFGSLELFATSVLALAVFFYLVRVGWIALSDARRMELKAVRSAVPSSTPYSGSSTAG